MEILLCKNFLAVWAFLYCWRECMVLGDVPFSDTFALHGVWEGIPTFRFAICAGIWAPRLLRIPRGMASPTMTWVNDLIIHVGLHRIYRAILLYSWHSSSCQGAEAPRVKLKTFDICVLIGGKRRLSHHGHDGLPCPTAVSHGEEGVEVVAVHDGCFE
jgi:hypothetical protein